MHAPSSVLNRQGFSLFICKITSRCNLACDYCYVYFHADQGWRQQPKVFSQHLAACLGQRLLEHATAHRLPAVDLVLHGGEPFLLKLSQLGSIITTIQENSAPLTLRLSAQTNATLINEEILEWCLTHNLRLGVSIDGAQAAQDRHRRDHYGRSSFAATVRGLELLNSPRYKRLLAGLLCVIDLRSDPVETYRFLSQYCPPVIDFLLPFGNHDALPPGKYDLGATPYADWLLKVFDYWYTEHPQTILIRKFRDIIGQLLNYSSTSEQFGGAENDFIVVETDGAIEATDSLKTTYPGATSLGLNIINDPFDSVFRSSSYTTLQERTNQYADECRLCPLFSRCGAGHLPTRYSKRSLFANPSIYCADIKKLFTIIGQRIQPGSRIGTDVIPSP